MKVTDVQHLDKANKRAPTSLTDKGFKSQIREKGGRFYSVYKQSFSGWQLG